MRRTTDGPPNDPDSGAAPPGRAWGPLPPAVRGLALRCGADPPRGAARVLLRQTGTMRADAAAPWAAFTARQVYELEQCGFEWRARTGPLGAVTVTDALDDAGPRLTVRALGLIPLVRARPDAALIKGELLRYLAELPLAPDAIVANRGLAWEDLGGGVLRVSAAFGDVQAGLTLTLGEDGLVASAFAPDRPRLVGGATVETPWHCTMGDYRARDGRLVPFETQAAWALDGGIVPVWRGRLTDWRLA
ncbi:MAG: hypothetical protein EON95_13130 [Caulobacteraceae bacterium]|nr:MAG: hypothetical protein EON95_13130 [Caulobacteraceae bacterium]